MIDGLWEFPKVGRPIKLGNLLIKGLSNGAPLMRRLLDECSIMIKELFDEGNPRTLSWSKSCPMTLSN